MTPEQNTATVHHLINEFVFQSICGDRMESDEIIFESANEKCTECGWNTLASDSDSITRTREKRVEVDHWIETDETEQLCPWCSAPTYEKQT